MNQSIKFKRTHHLETLIDVFDRLNAGYGRGAAMKSIGILK